MSDMLNKYPKVLIVMTAPFNNGGSCRTLDSYFHYWDKACVAQVYSRNCEPTKGHCSTFFRITDESLVKRWLGNRGGVGKVFEDKGLKESDSLVDEYSSSASRLSYVIGAKHTPTIELLRGLLWRKRFWCTEEFINWLDNFKPDCIVYNFSNHIFTQGIALFIADRFDIPIIPIIGDDYYFNDRKSLSLAYHLFKNKFKKLTRQVMAHSHSAVYCSDKCMRKYGEFFHLGGAPIYISSSLSRREFRPVNKAGLKFLYCGSIKLGRNGALLDIAEALNEVDSSSKLEVYTGDLDDDLCKPLRDHPNIDFGGSVGYDKVVELIRECDVFVVAEGFRDSDLLFTRYSLSTKAADGLASGAAVLAYGPSDAGVIEYLEESGGAVVCTDKRDLVATIRRLLGDERYQKQLYDSAIGATVRNHTLESSTETFKRVVVDTLSNVTEVK